MTLWLSLCWDYVTGDCRDGLQHSCAWRCDGCGVTRGKGRPQGQAEFDVAEQFNAVRNWLLRLNITGLVVVRDCHADIAQYVTYGDLVLDFDAHFDDERYLVANDGECLAWDRWNSYGGLDCTNWIAFVENHGGKVVSWSRCELRRCTQPVTSCIAAGLQ